MHLLFSTHLKHFISMQYGCGIELASIYHSFKVPDDRPLIWRVYFYSLVYTLLNGVIVFLLKKYFRWCEFNTVVPTVAYFTHKSWKRITNGFVKNLIQNNVIQNRRNLSPSTIYSNENTGKTYLLTYSIGRLSMKPSGKLFRLVVNANYQSVSMCRTNIVETNSITQHPMHHLSFNQRLRLKDGLYDFVNKVRVEFPGVYVPSLLSTNSAFNTLLSFRSLAYSIGFRRFWIAKLDILDCFNQIMHSKLLQIFSNILNEVSYYMYPAPNAFFLVRELEWFLRESIISIDGELYSFTKGIPQGSCISSDLANIYLAHLDRESYKVPNTILWSPHKSLQNSIFKTTNYQLTKCSTILRYLDDYLCISTSRIELQYLMKRINFMLNSYGLCLNERKTQTNLNDSKVPIKWLGLEVHSSLAITIPKSNPPIFCRFSGQCLSVSHCMRRLCKFRLHCSTWRFTFHKISFNTGVKRNIFDLKNITSRKTDCILKTNAFRLGYKLADIVWMSIKTSPEKDKLLQASISRRLAKAIFKCISINVGFSRFRLYRLTINAFIKRLLPHNGELKWLLFWIQQLSSLKKI
ncbi:Calcium-dependent protein kinase C isoform 2 [Schistosoma japonicum]|uniref:Telomerase reverse transcriptase n=1 Tax=Schistosoma japonicum TaxID=6182 RepID=A0A4Z2DRV2_SCHJA|nr:Calcium-dependent protein kinase C isoform 2 [Schistosoma japonicum]